MKSQKNADCLAVADQQGNALLTVMITMMLIMLLVSALIEHFLVAEARAVEESLAKVRVYWAMSGHVDYLFSRARRGGAWSAPAISDLSNLDPPSNVRTWDYGNNYKFKITYESLNNVLTIDLGTVPDDGSSIPILVGLEKRLAKLKVGATFGATITGVSHYREPKTPSGT